jgi:hypothetical protein
MGRPRWYRPVMPDDRAGGPTVHKLEVPNETRDRDLVIRSVRDELLLFMGRKLEKERKKKLRSMPADVLCVLESLAEAMAVLHVDVLRSLQAGDRDAYTRKVNLARAMEARDAEKPHK